MVNEIRIISGGGGSDDGAHGVADDDGSLEVVGFDVVGDEIGVKFGSVFGEWRGASKGGDGGRANIVAGLAKTVGNSLQTKRRATETMEKDKSGLGGGMGHSSDRPRLAL